MGCWLISKKSDKSITFTGHPIPGIEGLSENSQLNNSSVSDAKLYPISQYFLSGLVFKPENYFDVTCYHQSSLNIT